MNGCVGASSFLLGMTLAVTTITEVPCYFYSGSLLNRFGANKVVLHLLGKQASLQFLPSALTGHVVSCIHVHIASHSSFTHSLPRFRLPFMFIRFVLDSVI